MLSIPGPLRTSRSRGSELAPVVCSSLTSLLGCWGLSGPCAGPPGEQCAGGVPLVLGTPRLPQAFPATLMFAGTSPAGAALPSDPRLSRAPRQWQVLCHSLVYLQSPAHQDLPVWL